MADTDFNTIDLNRVRAETFVQHIEYHDHLTSTNDEAKARCLDVDVNPPLLVLTDRQTSGRGRGSHQWWASTGALTFSLVIDPQELGFTHDVWPRISLTIGLAICEAIDARIPQAEVGLKWPNDVFLNGRKICGVLIEVSQKPVERLIIGIGLNVNNSLRDAPDELSSIATSIVDETQQPESLTDWIIGILGQVSTQLDRLRRNPGALMEDWLDFDILSGRHIQVDAGEVSTIGSCEGIDENGALLVRTDCGLERLYGGSVAEIR